MIVPNEIMTDIVKRNVLAAAGYKYKWGWSKTKIDGCPCSNCKLRQPAGTKMIVLRSQYHGIAAALCPSCSRPTTGAVDLLDSSAKSVLVAQPANH